MRTTINVSPVSMTSRDGVSLSDELEKSMNMMIGQFIADLIAVKGAGRYEVVVRREYTFANDHMTFVLDARLFDGSRPGFPYPHWESLPSWVSWWTVSATGVVLGHELFPVRQQEQGAWISLARGNIARLGTVEVPIGIDWRTLCFERPTSMVVRHKIEAEDAQPQHKFNPSKDDSWGIFEPLKKFIP